MYLSYKYNSGDKWMQDICYIEMWVWNRIPYSLLNNRYDSFFCLKSLEKENTYMFKFKILIL